MELVFDRGVDPVHTVHYFYLRELINQIELILNQKPSSTILLDQFNEKFHLIALKGAEELKTSLELIDQNRMSYNEVRYTRLTVHLMLMGRLEKLASEENRELKRNTFRKLSESHQMLNSFVRSVV